MKTIRGDHKSRHIDEGFFKLKATPGDGMCLVKSCKNNGHHKKFSLCDKHYQHRWRMLNPRQSAFARLRDSAKRRGIEFKISYDYFLGLTDAYSYFDHNAETFGEFPSFDRIDGSKGYIFGNLRIVTVSQNCRKAAREKFLPDHIQSILDRKRARAKANPALAEEQVPDESDCPF